MQTVHSLNHQCKVPLTHCPSAIAESLVFITRESRKARRAKISRVTYEMQYDWSNDMASQSYN